MADKPVDDSDRPARHLDLALAARMGAVHARQRIGIEQEYEASVFRHGRNRFHPENWRGSRTLIHGALKLTGLAGIGKRNAADVRLRNNRISTPELPAAFAGFTVLHVSDVHAELSVDALRQAARLIEPLHYDICVLTGDYRALTYGDFQQALAGMAEFCSRIRRPIYGVLGNHDTIRMVPALEAMGIELLLNEATRLEREDETIHLAGIDDAHYFRVDNIEKAAGEIPHRAFSILLSHTPEVYKQAAHAGFDLMLSGHTHAGQICLPGGIALELNARLPREYGAGAWKHGTMQGYTSAGVGTSIVTARFNCPPEITLHQLEVGQAP